MKRIAVLLFFVTSMAHSSGFMFCSGTVVVENLENIAEDTGRNLGDGTSEVVLTFDEIKGCQGHSCYEVKAGDWVHLDAKELTFSSSVSEDFSTNSISIGNSYPVRFRCSLVECREMWGMERKLEYFNEKSERCEQLEQEGRLEGSDEELNVDSCKKVAERLLALEKVAEDADCEPFTGSYRIEVIQQE